MIFAQKLLNLMVEKNVNAEYVSYTFGVSRQTICDG